MTVSLMLTEVVDATNLDPRVPGRQCGDCTLCCKVLRIEEIAKPQGRWCPHCEIGVGCRIYDAKPTECTTYYCGYLTVPDLGEEWKPNRSKLVISAELGGNRIAVYVDPGFPGAWLVEPYYSRLKEWAAAALPSMGQVVVMIGRRAIVILPDSDQDLGQIGPDDRIVTSEVRRDGSKQITAMKLHKDDPRLNGLQPGVVYRDYGAK